MTGRDEPRAIGGRSEEHKAWLALVLSWVAGFVDALGYVTFLHVFTSHMSGNSVAMVAVLPTHDWQEVTHRAFPIFFFVVGVFLGMVLDQAARERGVRRRLSLVLGVEVGLLLGFLLYGHALNPAQLSHASPIRFHTLIVLLALAMGLQSAGLRRYQGRSVHTTFITGMLLHFAEAAADLVLHRPRRRQGAGPSEDEAPRRRHALRRMAFYGGIWLSFVVGGACGGFGQHVWSVSALIAPLCVLALIIAWDLRSPLDTPIGNDGPVNGGRAR